MPICVFDIFPDGTTKIPSDTALTGNGTYRWWHFDLSDPDLEPWASANLPAIPAGALLQPETRPRCDRYESGLILNLRGINMNEGHHADQMVSIRMWLDSDVIITVRLRRVFAIDEIRQLAVAQAAPLTTAAFTEGLVGRLTARVQDEVMRISKLTEFFEDDLEDDSTPLPDDLPETRRSVIKIRRYLAPQKQALETLSSIDLPLVPEPDGLKLRELANRTTIAVEELDALQERLIAIQDEHDLHVAQRQARHGYGLSVVAAIFLPLGFLTGLFGVNIGGMPGIDNPWAFAILCLSMIGLAALMYILLRLARWL
ncbi:MAG: zinc transporter ZntB [Sulfitobacter sp.]